MTRLDYRILGSLEALRDGEQVSLGGAKQRAVLALLLLGANRVVTSDELIEALWPERAPGKPLTAIQVYVSQLRKLLAPGRPFEVIVTEPAGYRLPIAADELDLLRLESLLRRGRDERGSGRTEAAAATFGEALALFRGPPLADFTYESWAQPEIGRLAELRLTCLEERIEADLQLGRHGELVGELEALTGEHPLRERFRGQLMLALYRAGRQSEALAEYQEARKALVEEFGIEPMRALQELERKMLLQDPTLDLAPVVRETAVPTGQVMLLFTDIEGSTRLLHRLGDDYAQVLIEHRRLLCEAFERGGGRVIDNYGDCFFAIFERPLDALAAAVAAQRALAGYPWPNDLPVRVRIGLHAGQPVAVGDGFVGLDVHRASRICDAAHGGQVLLSAEAAAPLGDAEPTELRVRDLGEHRLRDLPQPEHLFQLVAPGLDEEFSAPRGQLDAKPVPSDRSILVAAEAADAARALVELAAPLAHSQVPHELIVTRLIEVGEDSEAAEVAGSLARATSELEELRASLGERRIDARVASFTSAAVGEDVVRLASEQAVDLVLLGRSPSHLDDPQLDPELAFVLANAPCDVAVCVFRADAERGSEVVLVPFGGGAHDWAALELGAWLASAAGWRLRLLGVAGSPQAGKRDASRLLAAASLSVQQLVGVPTEPVLLPTGAESLLEAAADGGLLVAGIPDDWRQRGLGTVRAELARAGPVTTIFARRGVRPGGLAPSDSQTRYTWSLADVATAAR